MDVPWAIEELREYVRLSMLIHPTLAGGMVSSRQRPRGTEEQLAASAHVVEQILDRVLPDWRSSVPGDMNSRWAQAREAAARAIAQLEREAELREKLGDSSPQVSLGGLHPWVWDTARSFWQQGAFRVAVREAATTVNAHTQAKVNRYDVADDALLAEVFSTNPPAPGKPRLRLPGSEDDKTRASRQRGARDLGQGCFWALRNPATHQIEEWPEQSALEALCAFSLLARLVEECDVIHA